MQANEKGESTLTIDRGQSYMPGDLDGIAEVLKKRLKIFFETPISARLRELPALLEVTDKVEANSIRLRCHKLAELFDGDLVPGHIRDVSTELAAELNDSRTQQQIGSAFRVLLYQLMIEMLLRHPEQDYAFDTQKTYRSIWRVDDLTNEKLAGEIANMFDGPIKRRLDVGTKGRPRQRATSSTKKKDRKEKNKQIAKTKLLDALRILGGDSKYEGSELKKKIAEHYSVVLRTVNNWIARTGETLDGLITQATRGKDK